jgi:hypothetical protein
MDRASAGLLVAAAVWAIGWQISKPPGQSTTRVRAFPAVVDKLRAGWKIGETPLAAAGMVRQR